MKKFLLFILTALLGIQTQSFSQGAWSKVGYGPNMAVQALTADTDLKRFYLKDEIQNV